MAVAYVLLPEDAPHTAFADNASFQAYSAFLYNFCVSFGPERFIFYSGMFCQCRLRCFGEQKSKNLAYYFVEFSEYAFGKALCNLEKL
ncbi:hypothetical protein EB241_06805 [Erwinia psidii]|uniref:Uncharacterized protein n=1 Tax=Erwinia psidii TaxID=69224 RepID=A0A3N6SMF7_9GAMM|nr:hypothetical protein EB241_06805 [Erwinia psidii]